MRAFAFSSLALIALSSTSLCSSATAQRPVRVQKVEDQQAAKALFLRSDLPAALQLAQQALRSNPGDRNAWFVQMEAASLRGDDFTELKSAINLVCTPGEQTDPRIQIALGHIASRAANTAAFQAIAPKILRTMEAMPAYSPRLALALLTAEEDGYQRLTSRNLSRIAGLLTDWKLVGNFGKFANSAFDQNWPPEVDLLNRSNYGGRIPESFRFDNGVVFVPDYFAENGVLYGASEIAVQHAGMYMLKVESRGTLQVLVNGLPAVLKDDRYIKGPEVQTRQIALHQGKNQVFIKLLPSASPFRISLVPVASHHGGNFGAVAGAPLEEQAYIRFATAYWTGNYAQAEEQLKSQQMRSGPALLLAAELYAAESLDSGSELPILQELLQRFPEASAAELILAERAYGSEHYEESLFHLGRALANTPNSPKAQELRYELASHFGWQDERKDALRQRLSLHPSCGAFAQAEKFHSNALELNWAADLQSHLEHCASLPSLYWESLNQSGQPALALRSMFSFSRMHSLDRSVRLKLVRQLVEMGQTEEARQEAKELVNLSPNSAWFTNLARNPEQVLDGPAYARRKKEPSFFLPYRRDALSEFSKQGAAKAVAEIIFDDQVVTIHKNRTADVYHHRLLRVWNKAAIEEFGEVNVPRGVEIFELRTLKQGGGFVEPELTDNKHSVSMPSLVPGNAIEIEYVQHLENYAQQAPSELSAVFGMEHAQVQDARYILISPADHDPLFWTSASSGKALEEQNASAVVRTWHFTDLPAFSPEPSMSAASDRPEIRIIALDPSHVEDIPAHYQNDLIDAAQVTRRIQSEALKLRRQTTRETAEAIYDFVISNTHSTDDDWTTSVTSADETLETGEGSRSALLIALAAALNIKAELLLSIESGARTNGCLAYSCYRHPLVRFDLPTEDENASSLLLDPIPESLAPGALTPTLQNQTALVIPLHAKGSAFKTTAIHSDADQHSIAEAELLFKEDGELQATVKIQLGSWRSAQVRSVLRQLPQTQWQGFFEELTTKIFPGAVDIKGNVGQQENISKPLELQLSCRVPHFAQWENDEAEIRQLIPQLSLRSMYASLPSRKFPLLIDTPLQETTTFTLHLPQEIMIKTSPQSSSLASEFGVFKAISRKIDSHTLEVVRDFDIAVQTIPPERYSDFAAFASQTEQADRQQIVLSHTTSSARASAGQF